MATMVHIREGKRPISELLARITLGEELIIAKAGKPIARLTPIIEKKPVRRVPGSAAGELVVPPDFDDPLPEYILESFEQ